MNKVNRWLRMRLIVKAATLSVALLALGIAVLVT